MFKRSTPHEWPTVPGPASSARPEEAETEVIPVIVEETTPLPRVAPGSLPALVSPGLSSKGYGSAGWVLNQLGARIYSPPRRPWRRVWCWAVLGHYYSPDADACLDCGKRRPDLKRRRTT